MTFDHSSPIDDTVVVDTAELKEEDRSHVQVFLDDGYFHRELDHHTTSCDQVISRIGAWIRPSKLEDRLCPVCFTKKEIERAAENDARNHPDRYVPLKIAGNEPPNMGEWIQPSESAPSRKRPDTKGKP